MSKNSQKVQDYRVRTKKRMVESMGGECQICGYNNYIGSLDFHHIDPSKKEFSFGRMRANPKEWSTVVKELKKSILLCSNCHREVHAGVAEIPENYQTFNEDYTEYRSTEHRSIVVKKPPKKAISLTECPSCSKLKTSSRKYCCHECYLKSKSKIDWENLDWDYLLSTYKTNVAIGKHLGVSDSIVSRNKKRLLPSQGV